MAYPVKFFNSEMGGAPQLTNAFGSMTALLDACLVNGFNALAPTSLTFSGGVVTVTYSIAHGYIKDQIITISGCTQTEYNGDQRVTGVTLYTLTYSIAGTPASPATTSTAFGSITTPLGFVIGHTATNKRAYRSNNSSSNKPYLRVDDAQDPVWTTTYAKKAKVLMCQDMYDINTPKGAYAPYAASGSPPIGGINGTGAGTTAYDGWYKWYYAKDDNSAARTDADTPTNGSRKWVLIGDDRGFFISNDHTVMSGSAVGSYGKGLYCFTDFYSFKTGDGFNTILTATDMYTLANYNYGSWTTTANCNPLISNDSTGKILMRDHHQQSYHVPVGFVPLNTANTTSYSGYTGNGMVYPNGPDYGIIMHPVYLRQTGNSVMRGKMPGMYWIHNDSCAVNDQTILDTVTNYAGRKFMIVSVAHQTYNTTAQTNMPQVANGGGVLKVAFDITGPWW